VSTAGSPVLDVKNVTVQFGGLRANEEVDLDVRRNELFALIGPNGAGKTTLVNAITGIYRPLPGASIRFRDAKEAEHDLLGRKPHNIVKLGIGRTFQNLGLYAELSVLENLMLGRYVHRETGILSAGFYTPKLIREELEIREAAEEIIHLLRLEHVRWEPAGGLPYGLQKRVEFGRVLSLRPHLLMLDEPMAGMTVDEKKDMVRFIYEVLNQLDITILIIEHDMGVVMSIADRVMVLNFGRRIGLGSPDEVQRNQDVRSAYLGS
jgi:branched-chain amino acid transport system ATP-binding protein